MGSQKDTPRKNLRALEKEAIPCALEGILTFT
jgi:hypothetical protein